MTVTSNKLPMGMAELNELMSMSQSVCPRGALEVATALTISDDEYSVCNCQMPERNGFQPQLGKRVGIFLTHKPQGQQATAVKVLQPLCVL